MTRKRKVEAEEVYHVEVITKARVSEDGEWEYLVKWAGYESDADSWEPTANVKQCGRLLASFWKHVGTDDHDYPIGFEIAAKEDWINKEKRYFKETYVKPSKGKSVSTTKQDRQERCKSTPSISYISESTASGSRSSDEEFSADVPAPRRLYRKTRVVDTESDSDSDSHMRNRSKAKSHPKATMPPSKDTPKVPGPIQRHDLSLRTGSSTSTTSPKITAVRTHQDQRTNPLVKSMSLPSKSVEAGSSLSTKQRVAAGIPPSADPKPPPHLPKKSLLTLSFKKNKPTVPPGSQTKDTIMASAAVTTPASPVGQSAYVAHDADMVASPQPMDIDQPVDIWDSVLEDAGSLGESSGIIVPTVPIPLKSQEEINAEKFLQTIHIPVLSAPLETGVIPDQPDQPINELAKTLTVPKIPKKWKWSGDLFISTSESKMELLCAVTIADPSGTSNTSHINLLLSSLDSLQIPKLHPIMDLSPLLRACGKSQYFGILESSEPSEEAIIHGFEHYLTSEGLAAAIPLLLDALEVAVLIVFPGAQQGLTKVLQVPEHLLSGTPLLVVLLPFLVSAMASTNVADQKSIEATTQSLISPQGVLVPHEHPQEAVLYQAMSLLCFPKTLLDFFNNTSTRTYCIWPSPDQTPPGLDTVMLQYILKSTKAVQAKLEEDVRVVFIFNQHLKTLHAMPSLVTKLANCPETQFWTYGCSASVTCQRWRVQEVYPLGGIVTFTSSALVEDVMGCCELMSQIIEHPLWDCYLIPEVLAVTHLLHSNGDLGSSNESCLDSILDFINLGLITITRMPEKGHSNKTAWLSQAFSHSSASGHELLEHHIEALKSHPTTLGMTAQQLITFTNNEITRDLSNAQIQPAFMENYRRFVVIRAASEDTIPLDKDGLEWSSVSLFCFKDDYFQP